MSAHAERLSCRRRQREGLAGVGGMDRISIVVLDDAPSSGGAIGQLLADEQEIVVVGEGRCGRAALDLSTKLIDGVMVLGLSDPRDSLTVIEAILRFRPDLRILVVVSHTSDELVRAAFQRGVRAVVLRGSGSEDLMQGLRAARRGESYVTPTLAGQLLASNRHQVARQVNAHVDLSKRQAQALALIAKGYSNKEIGVRLSISERTVKHHVGDLFKKLQVSTRVQAALFASRTRFKHTILKVICSFTSALSAGDCILAEEVIELIPVFI
jgi:two-component system, NarL family, nitrate/nitrite response regulator NarL